MCLVNPTTKGIDKLPECGVYYKVMMRDDKSIFHNYEYCWGVNVFPVKTQVAELCEHPLDEYSVLRDDNTILIKGGAHFYRYRADANSHSQCHCPYHKVVRFRIHKKDIDLLGRTRNNTPQGALAIVARKARRID